MLIVVRHGRTAANARGELLGRRDPALDDEGLRQAAAVASAVGPVARVISSPLARCVQTARALAPEVDIDDRLIEIDYGSLEGTAVSEVPATTWEQWRSDNDWSPPGGESHNQLATRVWQLLDELADDARGDDIVLVTHVSPIKAALAWSLGVPIDVSWRSFVAQASIARISIGALGPSLHAFNDISHLTGD